MQPQPVDQVFDSRQHSIEKVRPRLLQVVQRAAVTGLVRQELVKIGEGHRAALQIAVRARLFEKLHQLVALDRRAFADVLQHAFIRELDDRVAEVEDEPGDFGHCRGETSYFTAGRM